MDTLLLQLAQVSNGDKEKFVLFGLWLVIFILAVALCRYLLDCISRTFEATCDWLEHRLAKRKVRRRSFAYMKRSMRRQGTLHKQSPEAKAVKAAREKSANVLPYKLRGSLNAQEALRRSCSNQIETDTKVVNSRNTRDAPRPR